MNAFHRIFNCFPFFFFFFLFSCASCLMMSFVVKEQQRRHHFPCLVFAPRQMHTFIFLTSHVHYVSLPLSLLFLVPLHSIGPLTSGVLRWLSSLLSVVHLFFYRQNLLSSLRICSSCFASLFRSFPYYYFVGVYFGICSICTFPLNLSVYRKVVISRKKTLRNVSCSATLLSYLAAFVCF